ncbi:MAG: hypothetical protein AB1716_11380 [Planctomycetota bacterium]
MGQTETLIEKQARTAAERRAAAARDYRAVLTRNAHPKPGDEKLLAEAAALLGRTRDQIADDAALVAELEAAEPLAGQVEALREAVSEAHAATAEQLRRREAAIRETERVHTEAVRAADAREMQARAKYDQAKAARGRLDELRDRWESVETGDPPGKVRERRLAAHRGLPHGARPDHSPPAPPLDRLRRVLRLPPEAPREEVIREARKRQQRAPRSAGGPVTQKADPRALGPASPPASARPAIQRIRERLDLPAEASDDQVLTEAADVLEPLMQAAELQGIRAEIEATFIDRDE